MTNIPIQEPVRDNVDGQYEQDQRGPCPVGHLHGDPFPGKDIEMNGHGPARREEGGGYDQRGTRGQDDGSRLPNAPPHTQYDACKDSGYGIR